MDRIDADSAMVVRSSFAWEKNCMASSVFLFVSLSRFVCLGFGNEDPKEWGRIARPSKRSRLFESRATKDASRCGLCGFWNDSHSIAASVNRNATSMQSI